MGTKYMETYSGRVTKAEYFGAIRVLGRQQLYREMQLP